MSESITIEPTDVPLCRIALGLLDKALKQGEKIGAVLDLPRSPLEHLRACYASLAELFVGVEHDEEVDVPGHLRRPLRLGVAIEFDRVVALQEAQTDLLVPAGDITRARLRQLEGLLAALDDQMSLVGLGNGETDEDEE